MAPPEGPRGKRRAAAPTTPAPRRPGTRGAGGPVEGDLEEESRRRASAPAPARPGEAGPAENCAEERAHGQLMLDLVSKNGNRDSKTHRFSSLPPPPLLIVVSSLLNRRKLNTACELKKIN